MTSALSPTAGKQATRCRLLELPGELRNRIYRMVVVQKRVEVWRAGYQRPPLINTCKAIRNETLKLYYEENTFHFHLENFEATTCSTSNVLSSVSSAICTESTARRLLRLRRGTMFPKGLIRHWPNLLKLLRHVHAGEFRLDIVPLADREKGELHSREVGDNVVFGMLVIWNTLRGEAWEAVKKVIMDQKALLTVLGTNWVE